MSIEQVDVISLQPLQTALYTLADVFGVTSDTVIGFQKTKFRGQKDLVSVSGLHKPLSQYLNKYYNREEEMR
jgi:hypothetical protein